MSGVCWMGTLRTARSVRLAAETVGQGDARLPPMVSKRPPFGCSSIGIHSILAGRQTAASRASNAVVLQGLAGDRVWMSPTVHTRPCDDWPLGF